jgi:copper chaperone
MTTHTFNVPEVHCDHCVSSIEGAVGAISGVDDVKVDLAGRTVEVSFDESAVEIAEIVTAIEDQGYEVASDH